MAESYNKGGLTVGESHTLLFAAYDEIEIRVVDEEGKPLKEHAFKIELADGQVIKGKLDADGWTKHYKVKKGEVIFKLVEPEEALEWDGGGTHFVNIVVKDEEDRPLEGEQYTLVLPGGKQRKGTLDKEGRALEENIPAGPCFFALRGIVREATESRHLRLQFMDEDKVPMANLPFEIEIDGDIIEGMTNDEGRVIADIPGEADDGELTIWLDKDKSSGEAYTWPIRISEVASSKK